MLKRLRTTGAIRYIPGMRSHTLHGFQNELQAISSLEKDAGLKEMLQAGHKAVTGASDKVNDAAIKAYLKIINRDSTIRPGNPSTVGKAVDAVKGHISDPANVADVAQTLGRFI